jgi:hypothetical protein
MKDNWTPENIAALIAAATALVGAIGTLYHSLGTRTIANQASSQATAANVRSNAVASALLSNPPTVSNKPAESAPDQPASEQPPGGS